MIRYFVCLKRYGELNLLNSVWFGICNFSTKYVCIQKSVLNVRIKFNTWNKEVNNVFTTGWAKLNGARLHFSL